MINVLIIGGSGYVGGELLKFLLFHPYVKIMGATSQSHIGKKISDLHLNLKISPSYSSNKKILKN